MNNEILFSKKAYSDGYNFSSMSRDKQILTNKLYFSEGILGNIYDSRIIYRKMQFENVFFDFDCDWVFDRSGVYIGTIISCEKIRRYGSSDYVMNVLLDQDTIRHIKFNMSFSDPMRIALKEAFKISPGVPFDLSECAGKLIKIKIENTTTKSGTPFSKLVQAQFLTAFESETIYEMIDLMIEQSEDDEEA